MRVLGGREARTEVDGPPTPARPASPGDPSSGPADGQLSSEGVVMRTLNESEWVPAAGEPEYPPHVGSGSFEPEPQPVDENGDLIPTPDESVEPAPEPGQDPPPEPDADVEATDGEPAGDAEAPADPEPLAEG